jgi:hypothetical protein
MNSMRGLFIIIGLLLAVNMFIGGYAINSDFGKEMEGESGDAEKSRGPRGEIGREVR